MEVALLASCVNTLLPRLWDKRQDANKRRTAIDINMKAIRRETERLYAALEDAKLKGDGTSGDLMRRQTRELSQETRDCIQHFFIDDKANCTEFATKTQDCIKRLQNLCVRLENHSSSRETPKKPQDPHVANPMGMDGPRDELLDLLEVEHPGMPSEGRRKVISIVGFPGLGKTLLAKLVYDHDRTSSIPHRARVTAADSHADEVLRDILNNIDPQGKHDKLNLEKLAQLLAKHLRAKRYLIVIDDIQSMGQWEGMSNAFPTDGQGGGTIIVTTTVQSVANVCSPCSGYVYKLSPLDEDKSIDLFYKDRTSWARTGDTQGYAKDIIKKCDGLPLAIVSMSLILRGYGVLTREHCRKVCTGLGASLMEEGGNLERLRWVLMNKYTGLTGDPLRCCLLYFCMYKHNMDAVPRKNSMVRRWEAEGFLVERYGSRAPTLVAGTYHDTLVDRNIIQSMGVGSITGSSRRCQPTEMMMEYISQISMSEDFAASLSNAQAPGKIRRLSFNGGSADDDTQISGMDLSLVLTLVISGIGSKAILSFKMYKLLAVLDLKECTNLEDRHVVDICQLLLLKYLSLGKSIGNIPRDIGHLELIETLEMRTTETVKVYTEVLQLPNLKHLLGKFQLNENPKKILYDFLEAKSRLQKITAYVSETAKGFPDLMLHMLNLRKVKIFCTSGASARDKQVLARAIKEFILRGTDTFSPKSVGRIVLNPSYSLSIDFKNITPNESAPPLEFLQCSGSLTSLKWRGDWRPFQLAPHFTKISGINKLCLSRTYRSGKAILDGLNNLIALEYLKLDEDDLGPLLLKSGTLQRLRGLCLVSKTSPQGITIQPKALPALVSLHLMCKSPVFQVEDTQDQLFNRCLESLEEIALHSEVEPDKKIDWKNAAKSHHNRPVVLLIQKDGPIRRA